MGAEVHGIDPVIGPAVAPLTVTVKSGTAEEIPYPDSTFDLLISRSVLEHLRDPERG